MNFRKKKHNFSKFEPVNSLPFQGAIDAAVKTLLALKADYKKATGKDWKPGATPPGAAAAPAASGGKSAQDLDKEITDAGNKVRQLKSDKAAKVR